LAHRGNVVNCKRVAAIKFLWKGWDVL
jgi:hypothetical protein